jgi:hypothetical protein
LEKQVGILRTENKVLKGKKKMSIMSMVIPDGENEFLSPKSNLERAVNKKGMYTA